MLSRRSVRVKVMQILYTMTCDEGMTLDEAIKTYWSSVGSSFDLLLFNIYNIVEITRVAVTDAEKRSTKHLISDYDKVFSDKLFSNPLIQDLEHNPQLAKDFKKLGFQDKIDADYFKKLYKEFSEKDEYKAYIENPEGDHLAILLELYRFCRASDYFNEVMEDHFMYWTDDKSLIIGALKKCLKSLPSENKGFYKELYPDNETVKEYGEELLKRTYQEDTALLDIIKPLLKNWDHERVAQIDMISIKMATAELLHFPTIPTKVSLNEYVEVSKHYSTPKSKDFINGVLDKVLHDLMDEGKINKEGRGLVE